MSNQLLKPSKSIEGFILGACMIDNSVYTRIAPLIREELFSGNLEKITYKAIKELQEEGKPSDLLAVYGKLRQSPSNLCLMLSEVGSTETVEYYALVLNELWAAQELLTELRSFADKMTPANYSTNAIIEFRAEVKEIEKYTLLGLDIFDLLEAASIFAASVDAILAQKILAISDKMEKAAHDYKESQRQVMACAINMLTIMQRNNIMASNIENYMAMLQLELNRVQKIMNELL